MERPSKMSQNDLGAGRLVSEVDYRSCYSSTMEGQRLIAVTSLA
jgi:hypothetical protein